MYLMYFSGYLQCRLLRWHNCDTCELVLHDIKPVVDSTTVYMWHRSYSASSHSGLIAVFATFQDYTQQCESIFNSMFAKCGHQKGISSKIVHHLLNVPLTVAWLTFPKVNFFAFFVWVRIFYMLKFNNRDVRQTSGAKKNKKLTTVKHI